MKESQKAVAGCCCLILLFYLLGSSMLDVVALALLGVLGLYCYSAVESVANKLSIWLCGWFAVIILTGWMSFVETSRIATEFDYAILTSAGFTIFMHFFPGTVAYTLLELIRKQKNWLVTLKQMTLLTAVFAFILGFPVWFDPYPGWTKDLIRQAYLLLIDTNVIISLSVTVGTITVLVIAFYNVNTTGPRFYIFVGLALLLQFGKLMISPDLNVINVLRFVLRLVAQVAVVWLATSLTDLTARPTETQPVMTQ